MGFWPDDLGGWTHALQSVAVAAGSLSAVRTFATSQRHKAAEILLEVERGFREVRQTCDRLTAGDTQEAEYLAALGKREAGGELDEKERKRLDELDQALRFFFHCSVLNTRLGVDLATLELAYSFYLRELIKPTDRPGLRAYIELWYPGLFAWISKQDLGAGGRGANTRPRAGQTAKPLGEQR